MSTLFKGGKSMKDTIVNVILILVGNFFVALSVACFIVPNEILSGGVAGVAVALHPIFPFVDTTLLINIITISLFLVGSLLLGKSFFLKTLLSTLCYPVFLSLLTYLVQGRPLTDSPIIASLYSGIFVGLGVGIVFRTGSSTGGMDIPALLMEKYLHIPLSTACLIIDGLTVILGISTYSLEAALVGLISVYASSFMIDKAISFGGQKTKSVMIISSHYEAMLKAIIAEIDRGATLLHAQGGYTREDREVVLVVIDNKQYPKLNKLINEIDPNAFLVVQDAQEVTGNGFTYYKELEKIAPHHKEQ